MHRNITNNQQYTGNNSLKLEFDYKRRFIFNLEIILQSLTIWYIKDTIDLCNFKSKFYHYSLYSIYDRFFANNDRSRIIKPQSKTTYTYYDGEKSYYNL